MNVAEYLQYLQSEYFENRSDAIEFASHITGIPYALISYKLGEPVDINRQTDQKLSRIKSGEPLAYVINNKNFYGLDIYVDENVLIPRPETEILVDEVLKFADERKDLHILDICTGSGCILTALLSSMPDAKGIALDISEGALSTAKKNAEIHNIYERACFIIGDALHMEELDLGTFDIVTCNPPYLSEDEWLTSDKSLKYEPKNALSAGKDDILFYKKLLDMIPYLCNKNGGGAFFELGIGQYEKLLNAGYAKDCRITRDYQHIERVVSWINL